MVADITHVTLVTYSFVFVQTIQRNLGNNFRSDDSFLHIYWFCFYLECSKYIGFNVLSPPVSDQSVIEHSEHLTKNMKLILVSNEFLT